MKALCNQWHLTQRELAALIGVSNSVIAMYEKGRRSLPAKAALKLATLQMAMQQNDNVKKTPSIKLFSRRHAQHHKAQKLLKAHAQKAAADALRISQELERMQLQHRQLEKKLDFLQALMAQAQPGTRQMSLLENLELDVLDAMEQCCPAKQELAAYKISLCNARQQAALHMHAQMEQAGELTGMRSAAQ